MKAELRNLIEAYKASVSASVALLKEAGVALPHSANEWSLAGPRSGALGPDASFTKHGIGCTVHLGGTATDFDFGPDGEIDGFDAWRLFRFANDHGVANPYENHQELNALLLVGEAAGEVARFPGSTLFHLCAPQGPTSASSRRADARGLS